MEGTLSRTTRPWIVLLESGCAPAYAGAAGTAAVEGVLVALPTIRTEMHRIVKGVQTAIVPMASQNSSILTPLP